jgi:hypothetical protein
MTDDVNDARPYGRPSEPRPQDPGQAGRDLGAVRGRDSRARSDQPQSDLPAGLSKPARRALAAAGYAQLEQLNEVSEAEVMKLHGMGSKALERLRSAHATRGRRFANS